MTDATTAALRVAPPSSCVLKHGRQPVAHLLQRRVVLGQLDVCCMRSAQDNVAVDVAVRDAAVWAHVLYPHKRLAHAILHLNMHDRGWHK
jgi:hypothetical protein